MKYIVNRKFGGEDETEIIEASNPARAAELWVAKAHGSHKIIIGNSITVHVTLGKQMQIFDVSAKTTIKYSASRKDAA